MTTHAPTWPGTLTATSSLSTFCSLRKEGDGEASSKEKQGRIQVHLSALASLSMLPKPDPPALEDAPEPEPEPGSCLTAVLLSDCAGAARRGGKQMSQQSAERK